MVLVDYYDKSNSEYNWNDYDNQLNTIPQIK